MTEVLFSNASMRAKISTKASCYSFFLSSISYIIMDDKNVNETIPFDNNHHKFRTPTLCFIRKAIRRCWLTQARADIWTPSHRHLCHCWCISQFHIYFAEKIEVCLHLRCILRPNNCLSSSDCCRFVTWTWWISSRKLVRFQQLSKSLAALTEPSHFFTSKSSKFTSRHHSIFVPASLWAYQRKSALQQRMFRYDFVFTTFIRTPNYWHTTMKVFIYHIT